MMRRAPDVPPRYRRLSLLRTGIVLGAAAVVLVLEHRRRARAYREPRLRHTTRNLAIAGAAAATVSLLETPFVIPMSVVTVRRGWGLTKVIGGPLWVRQLLAIVLLDYTLYVWHIATHHVPLLWRFHRVHHVDLDLDATTGLRFHAGELALSVPWRLAQIAIIGVSPWALLLWQSMTLASVLFHHSNSALPARAERIAGWLLVTPRMHAIHHSVDESQRDRNFSSGLSIWDRLHRTLRLDASAEGVEIGIPGYLDEDSVTLRRLVVMPFGPDRREHLTPSRT